MSMHQRNNNNHTKSPYRQSIRRHSFAAPALSLLFLVMQSAWLGAYSLETTMRRPGESRGRRNSPVTNTADPSRRREERNVARRNLWLPAFNRRISSSQTKTVAIETQISLGTPMIFPPGWQDNLLLNEQIEKLQDELEMKEDKSSPTNGASSAVKQSNDPVKTNPANGHTQLLLNQGSALVSQKLPAEIISMGHTVTVKPDAIAYIINMGKELAVYKLAGKGNDSVSIKSKDGNHIFEVSSDTAIFITEAPKFSESKLSKIIACKVPAPMYVENQMHVFSASFSYLQALDLCPQFRSCVQSKNPEKRALAQKLLKLSAARLVAGASP